MKISVEASFTLYFSKTTEMLIEFTKDEKLRFELK